MRKRFQLQHSLPSVDAVLGRLGYNPKKTDVSDWREQIEREIASCATLLETRGLVDTFSIKARDTATVVLDNGLVFRSSRLAGVLLESREVSIIVATLGQGVSDEIHRLLESGEITRASLVDAIASESVEHFVDWIGALLSRERLRLGELPTMRFSPGYGDWALDIQQDILGALGANDIGLSSRVQTSVLQPEKSITAVIGWEKR